jgi:REP element-mobilizing transposase RayT
MDRHWLLTWTTYGTWLPGDRRGFVSPVREQDGTEVIHNIPGTEYDADQPGLYRYAQTVLKCAPIYLVVPQALRLIEQFLETADYRGWALLAAAVMRNHAHLVAGVPGDPDPSDLLKDFKSYGSRALNRSWGKPASGTWWSESGSKRKLPDERAVRDAVEYVRKQPFALAVWVSEDCDQWQ